MAKSTPPSIDATVIAAICDVALSPWTRPWASSAMPSVRSDWAEGSSPASTVASKVASAKMIATRSRAPTEVLEGRLCEDGNGRRERQERRQGEEERHVVDADDGAENRAEDRSGQLGAVDGAKCPASAFGGDDLGDDRQARHLSSTGTKSLDEPEANRCVHVGGEEKSKG